MNDTSVFSSSIFQLPYQRTRALIPSSSYAKRSVVNNRLEELIRLQHGWDGYNAQPVNFENANFALSMLESICSDDTPTPQIVPGVNGDLQVEWHTHLANIELHVISPNNVYYWTDNIAICPNDKEIHLTTDFIVVLNQIRTLTGQPSDQAAAAR